MEWYGMEWYDFVWYMGYLVWYTVIPGATIITDTFLLSMLLLLLSIIYSSDISNYCVAILVYSNISTH